MRVATPEEFVAAPIGRYCVGEQFVVWAISPQRSGTIAWGRVSARSASALVALWPFERKLTAPYRAVVDVARVESVEPDAFEHIAGYMQPALSVLAQRIERQALIRPAGMTGALVAGFYPTLQPGFEWRDFDDAADAYRWCWPDDGDVLRDTLALLVGEAHDSAGLLPRVLAALAQRLRRPPTVAELGAQLSVSSRSLQRALQNAGTSLRAELTRLRLETAARKLRETDDKIEAIANHVGFASLSAFALSFRKQHGMSPSQYRQRGSTK